MKNIILSQTPNCWVAQFVNDENIKQLFGTDTIPTPFLPTMSASAVKEKIQKQNPDHHISIATYKAQHNFTEVYLDIAS